MVPNVAISFKWRSKPADALKAFTEKANETIKKLQNNKH